MKFSIPIVAILITFLSSCSTKSSDTSVDYGTMEVDVEHLKADYQNWWSYHYNEINLASEFVALDADSQPVEKPNFFEQLISGKYIPLKLTHEGTENHYKLYELDTTWNEYVSSTITGVAQSDYEAFKRVGQPFPTYNFKDLNGNSIDATTTKDKYLLVKCWFIACKPCIEEMPDLNKFKSHYEQRGDIAFVSLAIDDPEPLKTFLTKRKFTYPVVAEQGSFMSDEMGVGTYPTHIIVGKDGLIKKWVTRFMDLEVAMDEVMKADA